MARTTIATIKKFIRTNHGNLFIKVRSSFNGMTDGVDSCEDKGFSVAAPTDRNLSNTLGVTGAWFVGRSRDYFTPYDDGTLVGYEVYNCCGTFILAVKK